MSFAEHDAAASLEPPVRPLSLLEGGAAAAPGRRAPRRAAVIDLGSNSWRVVVYEYVPGGWWRRAGQLQEPVRIAEGMEASGRLSRTAIRRGLSTLEVFAGYCRARRIDPAEVDVVATSAIRDAENGGDLVAGGMAASGLAVRVLSAEEEARYGYLAAVNTTTLVDGAVLDLGGGSLQLVAVRGREAGTLGSWPLGAVRVTERALPGRGPASRKELKRARAAVRAELAGATWVGETGPRLVGVGGAVRNLAATALRAGGGPGASAIQGYVLSAEDVRGLVDELARMPPAARALPGVKSARADYILAATVVIEAVLELGAFAGIEVTRAGLREGVFFSRHLLAGRPPLIPDVRAASVRNLARQCDADLAHAEHVARLALEMHDSLAAAGALRAAPGERELLWSAAMLHDIGMAIAYDGHHEHSDYLIRSAGLAGFDPREVALVAQMVRYHRKGVPDVADLRPLAREEDREPVQRCALILRVAEQLERGHEQSVHEARLEPHGDALRLHLAGNHDLARWSLERQMADDAFRRVFGRPLVVAEHD